MRQVFATFGEFIAIVQKRRHLKLTFRRGVGEHGFWEQWREVTREILIRRESLLEGRVLSYYVWSRNCLLSNQQLTNTLFQLPNNSPVIDLVLTEPWVVVASTAYVLFIHSYKPMECFHYHDKVSPVKLVAFKEEKLVVVLSR